MTALPLATRVPPRLPTLAPPIPATTPLVSVVVVNYRRWEETATLIEQLVGEEGLYRDRIEVVVIDNASPSHPLEKQLRLDPRIRFHRQATNRGFSAGVNAGYRLSRGKWLLVLNADLHVPQGFLDLIAAASLDFDAEVQAGKPVGVVGFRLRNRDGSHQLSTGFFPSFWKMVLGLLRPRTRRKYETPSGADRQPVSWVTGSCVLVRRACLRELNGFDEDYFLYYEDVDLCLRAQDRGWSVCYEPAVHAVHLDPLQNRPLTEAMRAITRHASLTYFRKHLFGWQFRALSRLVRAENWLRQRWAELRGRRGDAAVCRKLRGICLDLARNRPRDARERLDELLQMIGLRS